MAVSANRLELLQIADAVAREKAIDRGIVIAAMEDAIQKAARSRYGSETEVRAEINPKTGEMRLSRLLLVVDQVENEATQIALEDAKKRNPAAQVDDYIAEALPPLEYGRIAAQSAKQVIVQKVREAERDRQYQEYKDRISISSTASSSASNTATSSSISAAARQSCVAMNCCRERPSATATGSAPSSTTCAASRGGRRYFSHALTRNSWPNCSHKKCRRFMTGSSR